VTVDGFDLQEYRRERVRKLERENAVLRSYRRKLEVLVSLVCPHPAVLAEMEPIVDVILARRDALADVRRRLPDLLRETP